MLSACMQPTGGAAAAAAHMPLLAGSQRQPHTCPCWRGSRSSSSSTHGPAGVAAGCHPQPALPACLQDLFALRHVRQRHKDPARSSVTDTCRFRRQCCTQGMPQEGARPPANRQGRAVEHNNLAGTHTPSTQNREDGWAAIPAGCATAAQQNPTCAACAESPHRPGPWAGWWRPAPARGQRPWCAGRPSAS